MRFGAAVGSLGVVVSCALAAPAQTAPAQGASEAPPSAQPVTTALPASTAAPQAVAPPPAAPSDAAPPPEAGPPSAAAPQAVTTEARATETQGAKAGTVQARGAEPKVTDAQELPEWSVGAGLSFTSWLPTADTALPGGPGSGAFGYAAIVEHRLGEDTWLALSAVVSFSSRDEALRARAADDELTRDSIRIYSGTTSALLGVRHTFVRRVVAVSFDAAAILSRQKYWRDDLLPNETFNWQESIPSRTYLLGAKAGLDVERELIEQLALRLTLDVGHVAFSSWEGSRIDSSNIATPVTRSGWRAGLLLQTGLQLHFYF